MWQLATIEMYEMCKLSNEVNIQIQAGFSSGHNATQRNFCKPSTDLRRK